MIYYNYEQQRKYDMRTIDIKLNEIETLVEEFKKDKQEKTVTHENYSIQIRAYEKEIDGAFGQLNIYDFRYSIVSCIPIRENFNRNIFCEELHAEIVMRMHLLNSELEILNSIQVSD